MTLFSVLHDVWIDLIHKNYRKLCNLLADVDEWGQVIIVNMLTRYGRTQFVDPNINVRFSILLLLYLFILFFKVTCINRLENKVVKR